MMSDCDPDSGQYCRLCLFHTEPIRSLRSRPYTVNVYGHDKICSRYGLVRSAPTVSTVSCYTVCTVRLAVFAKEQKTRTVNTVSTVMLPVSLRSIRSCDRINRMGSVIQALHGNKNSSTLCDHHRASLLY